VPSFHHAPQGTSPSHANIQRKHSHKNKQTLTRVDGLGYNFYGHWASMRTKPCRRKCGRFSTTRSSWAGKPTHPSPPPPQGAQSPKRGRGKLRRRDRRPREPFPAGFFIIKRALLSPAAVADVSECSNAQKMWRTTRYCYPMILA